jgi:hypothetical protein
MNDKSFYREKSMCYEMKFERERFRAVTAFPPGRTPRLYGRRGRPPLQKKAFLPNEANLSQMHGLQK